MSGINNLKEVHEKKGDDFLRGLLNNYVIVSEKVDGAHFGVKKSKSDEFKYFKKSREISYVDRVLMKYYNQPINYFESLPLEKRQRIPSNFYFGFEYFTRGDALSQRYDRMPKNNLILSYIHKLDDSGNVVSTVQNKEQLDKWADYLDVERPPIVFEGHLNDDQKREILNFIYSPSEELFNKFKTRSFTKFIISVLNDELTASFLKNDLDGSLDSMVFRFYEENEENPEANVFLAKMVDPIFNAKKTEAAKENKTQDYIWLIVIDLMNHFEVYDLNDLRKLAESGEEFEEKYINLINAIFKDFIKEYSDKYEGLVLDVPEYLKRPEFELNTELIQDPQVVKIIENETYREIYKILLNFFRKNRKNSSSGFFTPDLLTQLNLIVNKIRSIIMGDEVYESLFPSFNEFIGAFNEDLVMSEKEVAAGKNKKDPQTPVNLLIGGFQPITMGHVTAAKKLKEKNGNPVVLIAIKSKDGKKSPFSQKNLEEMLKRFKKEYSDLIEDFKVISSGQIEDVLEILQPKYKPTLWGTSEKRLKDYALQMDYIKKRSIPLRLDKEFKLVKLPVFVKSDEVINFIKDSNLEKFKETVPSSIVPLFFNLQDDIKKNLNEGLYFNSSFKSIFENNDIAADVVDPKLREEDSEKSDI